MSENGMELERLKVVVEADSSQYKKEMKELRNSAKEDTKELEKQSTSLEKTIDRQLGAVKKIREQMDKFYTSITKALKLPDNGINNMKQFESPIDKVLKGKNVEQIKNPLANVKGIGIKGFKNPLEEVFSKEELEQLRNPYGKIFNSQKEIEKNITSTERKMQKLISLRDELESTGGDIEMTAEFKDLTKAAEQAEKKLNSLIEKKERLAATGGLTTKNQRTLNYDISQAENEMKFAKAAIEDMPTSERYQNTEKWQKLNRDIGKCRTELAQYHAQEQKVGKGTGIGRISKSFSSLYAGLKKVTPAIKKVSGAFAALIQKFKNGIPLINRTKSSMGGLGGGCKGLGGLFRTIGMSAKFMFASFLIQGVLGQAKAGLQNLAQYSNQYGTQFNSSVTSMYSALKQLQNALATAFEPIVNVVAPYITTLINYLTMGANALAQFFSALTGGKTWTRATYNTQNYAASLDSAAGSAKKLKNELYGFDEITKQSDDDSGSGGSGGGGGGISPGDMFTEEAVNNQFADFANMVKDAWAKADFTEIGEIVGNKLNDALSNIKWDKIKDTIKRVASSVATFFNGFIKSTDWNLVGSTIAQGINTAVLGVHTFLTTFDWHEFGTSIATLLNGVIKTTDFGMLGSTVAAGVKAAVGTWYKFVTTFDFSQLGTKISDSINGFFSSMGEVNKDTGLTGWQEMGQSLSKSVTGIVESITTALETIEWEEVGQAIADFVCSIDWGGIIWDLVGMVESLGEGILEAIAGLGRGLTGSAIEFFTGEKLTDEQLNALPEAGLKALENLPKMGMDFSIGVSLDATKEKVTEWKKDIQEWWGLNVKLPVSNAFQTVKDTVGGWVNNVTDWWGNVKLSVSNKFSTIKSNVTGWWGNVKKWWGDAKLSVKNKFETVKNTIEGWKNSVSEWWGDVKLSVKNSFDTVVSNVSSWYTKVKNWWGNKTLSIKNSFDTVASNVSSWYTKVKNWWGNKTLSIKNSFDTVASNVTGWWENVKSWWGNKNLSVNASLETTRNTIMGWMNNVENLWNEQRRTLNVMVNATLGSVSGGVAALLNMRAEGGVYANGRWQPVTAYANGGTPNTGQLFVAREAGPELVGTIGGNTAVMNNNQIVASVAAGVSGAVYNAVVAAMARAGGGSSPEFNIYVGGKKITDVVIEEVNKRTKATGVSPIMV